MRLRVQIWHIYATSAFQSLVGAFESPARSSLLPYLVPRSDLMTAISLHSIVRRGTQIIGPAVGGVAIATIGVAGTYWITAGTYALLPLSLMLMRTTNTLSVGTERNPLRAVVASLRYVRAEPVIGPLLLMEGAISIFGHFNPMMVVFARDVFAVGSEGLGFLQSAAGAGSVAGSVALGALGDVHHKGRLVIASGVVYGLAVAAFALCPWFLVALAILVVVGAADMLMGTLRVTIIQFAVRGDFRGRVMSLQAVSTRGISPIGGFQMGAASSVVGVQAAVALSAMVCIAISLFVALRAPAVREFAGTGGEITRAREESSATA